jgi:hypothetical protein
VKTENPSTSATVNCELCKSNLSPQFSCSAHVDSSLADFCTSKMEAIRSSETSVHTKFTRRQITKHGILHSHRRKNLKSYKIILVI